MIVTLEGARILLDRALQGFVGSPTDLDLRLFKNDYTPTVESVLADFQESSFSGYYRQALDSSQWQPAATISDVATSQYGTAALTWPVHAGTETVFGCFIVHMATGKVIAAERASTPRVLDEDGTLSLLLSVTAQNAE